MNQVSLKDNSVLGSLDEECVLTVHTDITEKGHVLLLNVTVLFKHLPS